MDLAKLREARASLVTRGDELMKLAESRALTDGETSELEGLTAKVADHDQRIAALESAAAADASQDASMVPATGSIQTNAMNAGQQATAQADAQRSRFIQATIGFAQARAARVPGSIGNGSPHFVRDVGDRNLRMRINRAMGNYGLMNPVDPEDRAAAASAGLIIRKNDLVVRLAQGRDIPRNRRHLEQLQTRDQTVGTANQGGDWVAREFMYELEKYMLYYCEMREHARVVRTATGAAMDWPKANDTAVKGRRVAEATTFTGPTNIGGVAKGTINAYKYTSDTVKATIEFLQDNFMDFTPWVFEALAERIGRIQADEFTTGTGSSQPQGAVTGAGAGPTAANVDKVTLDDCLKLKHNVDIAYRKQAKYMMHDTTLLNLSLQKDAMGKYLLQDPKDPTQFILWGLPVAINNSMATAATTARSVLCGDFSRFIIRDVMDVTITRQDELFSNDGEVGFVAISRADSLVINSTAIKALVHP